MVKNIEEQCLWAAQVLGPRLNIDFTSNDRWAWWTLMEAVTYAGPGFEFREWKTAWQYDYYRLWESKVEGYVAIKALVHRHGNKKVTFKEYMDTKEYYHIQQMQLKSKIAAHDIRRTS